MDAPSPPTDEQAGLARPNASPSPMPKPKRPLSAYNLFYRFKRQKIVEALAAAGGAAIGNDAVRGVIASPPGLEGVPASATHNAPPDAVLALRRQRIIKDMEGNTDPRDTKARMHRKNSNALNGAMSFVELGRVMNSSWRSCDLFAKSVFDELSQAGRQRYRQRLAEYNARAQGQDQDQGQCEEEPAEAKATPAPAPAAPAPAIKKEPPKRRLPTKKYIAEMAKSSPSPKANLDPSASDDASAMNETADAMVRLAAGLAPSKAKGAPPTNGNETESLSTKNEHSAEARILPHLSSSGEVMGNGAAAMLGQLALAASNVAPQDLPPPPRAPPGNVAEELMVLRIKRLEVQLAEERLRARVQELEAEKSRRLLAREALERAARDHLLGNGLPGHLGHRPLSVQQQALSERERAGVLARIAELQQLQALSEAPFQRPSPTMPGSALPDGVDFDGRPIKRQRLDQLFPARRGLDF